MSKVECTAVNDLIDLVQQRPMDQDSDDDLFTATHAARLRGTEPRGLFELPPAPPMPAPVAQPIPQVQYAAQAPYCAPVYAAQAPYGTPPYAAPAPMHLPPIGARRATSQVDKYVPLATLARRFALPLGCLVGLGIATGIAYTAFSNHAQTAPSRSPSEVAVAAVAAVPPPPAPAPVAAPPAPKLVDVRLDSTPPGATATLLSNGISTPLGSTPVDASVDPTKSYDVVFSFEGKPSQVEHLDPSATQHVEVAFDATEDAPAVAEAPAKPAKSSRHHHRRGQAARVAVAPAHHSAKAPKSASSSGGAIPDPGVGNGTLAVMTDVPCAILVDDRNIGLTSPQRAIPLPAGHHNVRLIAATLHVNKLVGVEITAHHVARISQKFSK